MIIGALTLLSMIFFGNSIALLPLDHFRRDVDTYVVEKDRRKEIIHEIDNYEVQLKKNFQERNKNVANLFDLNSKYETTEDEYQTTVDTIMHQSKVHLHYLIDEWIKISSMFTIEEWTKIIDIDTSGLSKLKKQNILKGIEIRANSEEIKAFILVKIENKKERKKILETYDAFFIQYMIYFDNLYLRDEDDLKSFADYKIDQDRHKIKIKEYLSSEKKTFDNLKAFHFELKKFVEKKVWNDIMKMKNSIFQLEKV